MGLSPADPVGGRDAAVVLDVRDAEDFAAGHLPGAGHLPAGSLAERRTELPPRETEVVVVHDDPRRAETAARALQAMGYTLARWLDHPLARIPDGHASLAPAARLWRPSPFLERVRDRLPPGRALDLACGAGRNGVWLACMGWRAEAWDHDEHALARAHALAERSGVALVTRCVDLELGSPPAPEPCPEVIVVVRYLHRPLFPWIEDALAPGGALVVETFRRGQERHGHPRSARFLLEPGELALAFPRLRVEICEESEPEGGPVLARLLATKPRGTA